MNEKQFVETYCHNCGSQRCEGIGTEWFEGCKYKWNLDGQDPASEIERLNKKFWDLVNSIADKNVVRIVKCKDCIYNDNEDCTHLKNIGYSYDIKCSYPHFIHVSPEHFCSYGKRKEDNKNEE